MKKTRSSPLRMTSNQKSHQVAPEGKSNVKHRRGWSSKNRSSSQRPDPREVKSEVIHIVKRSMTGKPVLPMMIKKLSKIIGSTAVLNEFMLSGVRVKPMSMKAELGVKMPHQTRF